MRKAFAEMMVSMANKDDKLVLLIGDISHYLLKDFEAKFPNRFYNIGICEQSIISLAAGLASEGLRPVIHTIAPFCVERAFEQIKIDLCYQNLPATIISVGSSFDYAHLGCTHHCYEDTSILRSLPNIDVFVPGNSKEFKTLFQETWNTPRPKYFKLSKDEHDVESSVKPYEFSILNIGQKKTAIFVNGHLLKEVKKIKNIDEYTLIYSPTVEPICQASIDEVCEIIKNHERIVSIEENSIIGGFGDKITDIAFSKNIPILNKKIGIPRKFLDNYGTPNQHREALGLISSEIKSTLEA